MLDKERIKNIDSILKSQINPIVEESITVNTNINDHAQHMNYASIAQPSNLQAITAMQRYSAPQDIPLIICSLTEDNILRLNRSQYNATVCAQQALYRYEFKLTFCGYTAMQYITYESINNILRNEYGFIDYINEIWYNLARNLESQLQEIDRLHYLTWRE